MNKATFHSNRGEKSSLILVQEDAWTFGSTPVYVPRAACEGMEEGEEFEVDLDKYKIVPMRDENGEPRVVTNDAGEEFTLKTLAQR